MAACVELEGCLALTTVPALPMGTHLWVTGVTLWR